MSEVPHTIPDLLKTIKEHAELCYQLYPNRTVQIQIHPTTLGFIKIWMLAQPGTVFEEDTERKESLFGFQLFENKNLQGRYAIAILEEEERIWQQEK